LKVEVRERERERERVEWMAGTRHRKVEAVFIIEIDRSFYKIGMRKEKKS
jgi:hypothetical protein